MSQTIQSDSNNPLVIQFQHNLWANLRLLDACAELDETQLAATAVGTFGDIYKTLNHIIRAELRYTYHLTGRPQGIPLEMEDDPDVAALRVYAQQTGESLIAIAAGTTPSDLVHLEWDNLRWPIPAGFLQAQALTHSTEHRVHVTTIMTQLGVEPPDLSGWAYIEDTVQPTPVE